MDKDAKKPKLGSAKRRSRLKVPETGPDQAAEPVTGTEIDLLNRQLDHLQALQASAEATLKLGDATPALMRESANVARAVVSLSGEVEKRNKATVAAYGKLTLTEKAEAVTKWLLTLPPEMRLAAIEKLKERP